MSSARKRMLLSVSIALLLSACSNATPEHQSSETPMTQDRTTSTPKDTTTVARDFDLVACTDQELEQGKFPDPVDYLVQTDSWWLAESADLEAFSSSTLPSYVGFTARRVNVDHEPGEQEEIILRMRSSSRDLVEWGLLMSKSLYLGIDESPDPLPDEPALSGAAVITFVAGNDGAPTIGGSCGMRILQGDLEIVFDHELAGLSDRMISNVGEALALDLLPEPRSDG